MRNPHTPTRTSIYEYMRRVSLRDAKYFTARKLPVARPAMNVDNTTLEASNVLPKTSPNILTQITWYINPQIPERKKRINTKKNKRRVFILLIHQVFIFFQEKLFV
jgi:hypothetical protein